MSSKNFISEVIARLTIHRADRSRTIVEVHADATAEKFYQEYRQRGGRRGTKKLVRALPRDAHADLAAVAEWWEERQSPRNPITDIDIYLFRSREYRRLISAPPAVQSRKTRRQVRFISFAWRSS